MMLCGLSQHRVTLLVITVSESHRMARMLSSQVIFAIIQFNFSYRNGQVSLMLTNRLLPQPVDSSLNVTAMTTH